MQGFFSAMLSHTGPPELPPINWVPAAAADGIGSPGLSPHAASANCAASVHPVRG